MHNPITVNFSLIFRFSSSSGRWHVLLIATIPCSMLLTTPLPSALWIILLKLLTVTVVSALIPGAVCYGPAHTYSTYLPSLLQTARLLCLCGSYLSCCCTNVVSAWVCECVGLSTGCTFTCNKVFGHRNACTLFTFSNIVHRKHTYPAEWSIDSLQR